MKTQISTKIGEIIIANDINISDLTRYEGAELTRLSDELAKLLTNIYNRQHPKVEYSVETHGIVSAIKIFIDPSTKKTMATLAFERGGSETIEWSKRWETKAYIDGVTDVTITYDTRAQFTFETHLKNEV